MAVVFDNSGTKYIKWTAPSGVVGSVTKSLLLWYYHNANPATLATMWTIFDGTGTDSDEYNFLVLQNAAPLKLSFGAHFSTTDGNWGSTNNVITSGAWNHIAITYDGSLTANNAIMYVSGASVSVTRAIAPVGTYRSGTGSDFYVGTTFAANPNGYIASLCYYNVILSASEIADAYASRLAIPTWRGLVFAPQLHGAAGLQTFDGAALAAGNTIADAVSGALGVPNGSPVGRADTYLTFKP